MEIVDSRKSALKTVKEMKLLCCDAADNDEKGSRCGDQDMIYIGSCSPEAPVRIVPTHVIVKASRDQTLAIGQAIYSRACSSGRSHKHSFRKRIGSHFFQPKVQCLSLAGRVGPATRLGEANRWPERAGRRSVRRESRGVDV